MCIINIPRINAQLFIELTKNFLINTFTIMKQIKKELIKQIKV
jgi:hypothetical protein